MKTEEIKFIANKNLQSALEIAIEYLKSSDYDKCASVIESALIKNETLKS